MDEFNNFKEAHTCKDTLQTFKVLCTKLGLDEAPHDQFCEQLSYGLKSNWKAKSVLDQLFKKMSPKGHKENSHKDNTKVLIVGSGPCGLRLAIEAAFLGCKVVVIDIRDAFTRNNVLHLWPFVVKDLQNLGMKHFYSRFGCGELDHISIRRLQLSLLKIALIVGVEVHTQVTFKGLKCPRKVDGDQRRGWQCVCIPEDHPVSKYEFDVLFGATGAREALIKLELYNADDKSATVPGFDKKEFRGKLSIAIIANFVNENTPADLKAKEIGGISSHLHQQLFKGLKAAGIDLENFVYYKDETHYFVMTAKKSSLLKRGVFKTDFTEAADLMNKTNIDVDALKAYAKEAANLATNNELPNLKFALNSRGVDDVAMIDFSSKFEAVNASRIIEKDGQPLLIGLVGDSLLEPFWPQGTGCARGFLGALDGAWMLNNWMSMKSKPLNIIAQREIIAKRESIYKLLSQTTSENIKKAYSAYTIDPVSRYISVNLKAVVPEKAKEFYYNADTIAYIDKRVIEEQDGVSPTKQSKPDDHTDFTGLLQWLQQVMKRYKYFNVIDLTTSWRSGCELGSLIHVFRPQMINLRDLDRTNPKKTMSLVVDVAQQQLGISPLMTVSEMILCSPANEVEMASYLFQFYEMFHEEHIPESEILQNEDMKDVNTVPSMPDENEAIIPRDKERISKVTMNEDKKSDVCYVCKKELFIVEKITVDDMFCHRTCLKCDRCHCDLNLNNYRTKKSRGKVRFFCPAHAQLGSTFASSIRKRPLPRRGLSKNDDTDADYQSSHMKNDNLSTIRKEAKPTIPGRPDFLARRVTTASMRRIDFYNSRDDGMEEEAEEKVFEHNFGASIRGAHGKIVDIDIEDHSSSDSDVDDNIDELVEEHIGDNVDKNMTIKDAKTFWQTLKRGVTTQRGIIECLKDVSREQGMTKPRNSMEPEDIRLTEEIHNDWNSTIKINADDLSDYTKSQLATDTQRKKEELFEQRLKELDMESMELKNNKIYNYSTTCYRPPRQINTDKEETNKEPDSRGRKKPELKRCDSDQTDVRHAQRVQLAARKLARQRQQNKVFQTQQISTQLEEADVELNEIEKEGVEIEKTLKQNIEMPEEEKSTLRRKLCSLYNRRQTLLQYEAELHTANEQIVTTQDDVEQKENAYCLQSIPSDDDDDDDDDFVKINKSDTVKITPDRITKYTVNRNAALHSTFYSSDGGNSTKMSDDEMCVLPLDDKTSTSSSYVITPTPSLKERFHTSPLDKRTLKHSLNVSSSESMSNNRPLTPLSSEKSDTDNYICESIAPFPNRIGTPYCQDNTLASSTTKASNINKTITEITSTRSNTICSVEEFLVKEVDEKLNFVEPDFWECAYCTLHNSEERSFCEICYAWRCSLCTFVNKPRKGKCDMCYSQKPKYDQTHGSGESYA